MKARTIRFAVFAASLGVIGALSVRPTHAQSSEGATQKPQHTAPANNQSSDGTTQMGGCCGGGQQPGK